MAPAPIPRNTAPQIGEKIKPPNQVPNMAGAPAIVPNKTNVLIFGLLFNNGSSNPNPFGNIMKRKANH